MSRKLKIILIGILLGCIVIGGGKYYMNKKAEQQHEEMVAYVKKYHSIIENELRESDKKNFIKKIAIDYDTVEHNPLGGIDVYGHVNGNKEMKFHSGLEKVTVDGKVEIKTGGVDPSRKLYNALGGDSYDERK